MAVELIKPDAVETTVDGGWVVEHPTKRNAFEIVVDFDRPILGDPRTFGKCPTCNTVHFYKSYHILVNDAGQAFLSPEVMRNVRRAGMGDLRILKHTTKPPTVVVGTKGGVMGPVPQRTVIKHY